MQHEALIKMQAEQEKRMLEQRRQAELQAAQQEAMQRQAEAMAAQTDEQMANRSVMHNELLAKVKEREARLNGK
jgi:hypothetical protein